MKRRTAWLALAILVVRPAASQVLPAESLSASPEAPIQAANLEAAPNTEAGLPLSAETLEAPPQRPSLSELPAESLAPISALTSVQGRDTLEIRSANFEHVPSLQAAEERPASLGSFFDQSGKPAAGSVDAPVYLDGLLQQARRLLYSRSPDTARSLQLLETLVWVRAYLPADVYDRWLKSRGKRLAAIDRRLERRIAERVHAELAEGDAAGAREALEEIWTRHKEWASSHEEALGALRARLPSDEQKAEPRPPQSEPERLAEQLQSDLAAGNLRQADYLASTLEKKHPAWSDAHPAELAAWKKQMLQEVYRLFEARKNGAAPLELRRLEEYAKALTEGANRGFGYKQPPKQDPMSRMCTILSLYEAFEASMGFADPGMTIQKFTARVREILKDDGLGERTGLSTHRVKNLMKALGLPLKTIEMQERLRRPFEEVELTRLMRPDQLVIPVFIIAQKYPDEKGLLREEHKCFLRDAYFSETEKRWVYVLADPLLGRLTFYTWPELKPFLHKLFVVKLDKKLATP